MTQKVNRRNLHGGFLVGQPVPERAGRHLHSDHHPGRTRSGDPGGTVRFTVNGLPLGGARPVSGGVATSPQFSSLSPGIYKVVATAAVTGSSRPATASSSGRGQTSPRGTPRSGWRGTTRSPPTADRVTYGHGQRAATGDPQAQPAWCSSGRATSSSGRAASCRVPRTKSADHLRQPRTHSGRARDPRGVRRRLQLRRRKRDHGADRPGLADGGRHSGVRRSDHVRGRRHPSRGRERVRTDAKSGDRHRDVHRGRQRAWRGRRSRPWAGGRRPASRCRVSVPGRTT